MNEFLTGFMANDTAVYGLAIGLAMVLSGLLTPSPT